MDYTVKATAVLVGVGVRVLVVLYVHVVVLEGFQYARGALVVGAMATEHKVVR